MKLKKDFVLRQVANNWVVLPLGSVALDFNSLIKLNDSGAFLWKILENDTTKESLVLALTAEYNVSEAQASEDVDEFLNVLSSIGCLELE